MNNVYINKPLMSLSLLLTSLLSGCATDSISKTSAQVTKPVIAVIKSAPAAANTNDKITLERIMSNPDWIGRQPESWYWSADGNQVFYKQKREGNPLRDLFQLNLQTGKAEKVALNQLHRVSDRFSVINQDGSKEAYIFQGNVFVKSLISGEVQQITYTNAKESQPVFLTNGNIAFRQNNQFFVLDKQTFQLKELAQLLMADKPKTKTDNSFLAKEQRKLIQFIAKKQKNRALRQQQSDQLLAENKTVTNNQFYLGKGKEVREAVLSPAGDKILVSVANIADYDKSNIMPNYVTESGKIVAEPARRRVADNRKYNEELVLLDLKQGKIIELPYVTLPGFDEDVLAKVKAENFKAKGKTYISKRAPRNIYLSFVDSPILWSSNGKNALVMLEAWDNKDRWIASIDLKKGILVPQHRLHDDAWINWNFNEFGWITDNEFYFTSEQTGYAHLYSKTLTGEAKQLTHGKFEVSDVSLTPDGQSFVFKANKKHPGIYEIYQVNTNGSQFEALTDLGGMNDYSLSPDGTQLLIQHSTVTMPPELYIQPALSGAKAKRLTHTVSQAFLDLPWTAPSVVAIPSSHQNEPIYSKVYLPKNYDADGKKYRAVMFSHGAGYLQNSHLGWSGYFREFMFHSMLAQQGYVVIDMDYRASAGYGRDWRTAIYRHMGKPEVEDMRDGVNWLVKNANVDRNRIGTYGGSYGGFLTLISMFTAPDLFQAGSALRLVSDWAYYNHGYTSNILNTPEDDEIAYRRSSPIYFAEGLQKPLLINAPMVDSNVFFEDTVRLTQRFIELDKQNVETAIYPVENHGFKQPSSWLYEYRKIYKLFEDNL